MKEQLEKRLDELKAEFQKGQQRLQELETETANLRNALLRISGAIQVLTEELDPSGEAAMPAPAEMVGQTED